jgi:hypothetical protein
MAGWYGYLVTASQVEMLSRRRDYYGSLRKALSDMAWPTRLMAATLSESGPDD